MSILLLHMPHSTSRMLLIIQYMYAVYIGETGRELKTQIAEHKAAVRQANTNNAIASHVWNLRHNIQWKETSVLKHEGEVLNEGQGGTVHQELCWHLEHRPRPSLEFMLGFPKNSD